MSEESTNIKVAIRCRPLNSKEISNGDANCVRIQGNTITLSNPSRPSDEQYSFGFDLIFDEHSKQEDIWAAVGIPTLDKAFSGYNATIFAYGQTGSGKTWSMQGGENECIGIIPRMSMCVFEKIAVERTRNSNLNFLVTASYFEIYNEILNDLLENKKKSKPADKVGLEIKEHPVLGVYIKNLTEIAVDESSKLLALIDHGTKNRKVAMTSMNADSSRSHSILTLVINQKDTQDESKNVFAKLNLVDLAGSERQKSTNATGSTLKEGANINKSLSALGNVINALVEASNNPKKNVFIPYRNSKLTRVLQESLGGNSVTAMLAMLSCSHANLEESLSCLKYANRAKDIKVKVVKNEESSQLSKLNEEIRLLKEKLASQPHNSASTDSEMDDRHRANLADLEGIQQKSWQEKLELAKQYELDRKKFESEHKTYEIQLKLQSESNWKLLISKNDIELTMNHIRTLIKRLSQIQIGNPDVVVQDRSQELSLRFNSTLNDLLTNFLSTLKALFKNEERLKEQTTISNLNVVGIEKEFNKVLLNNAAEDQESAQNSPVKSGPKSSSLSESGFHALGSKVTVEYDHSQRLNNNSWKILRDKLNFLRIETVKLAKLQNENNQIFSQIKIYADLLVQYLYQENVYSTDAIAVADDGTLNIARCWVGISNDDQFEANRGVVLLQRQVAGKASDSYQNRKASLLTLFNIAKYGGGVLGYLSHYFSSSSNVLSSLPFNESGSAVDAYRDTQKKIVRDHDNINAKLISTIDSFASFCNVDLSLNEQISVDSIISGAKVVCSTNSQLYLKSSIDCGVGVDLENCWFSPHCDCSNEESDVYLELVFSQMYSMKKIMIQEGRVPLGNKNSITSNELNREKSNLSLSNLNGCIQTHSIEGISIFTCNEDIETTKMLLGKVTNWEFILKKTAPDKFLKRPPVKFIFDVIKHFVDITAQIAHGSLPPPSRPANNALFPREVVDADWDVVSVTKESKLQFMDCVLSFVSEATKTPAKTNSNNIVTGNECGLTNAFLQELTLVVSAYKAISSNANFTSNTSTKPPSNEIASWVSSAKLAISKNGIDWDNQCDCEFNTCQGGGIFEYLIPSALPYTEGQYLRIYPRKWDYDRSSLLEESVPDLTIGPSMRLSVVAVRHGPTIDTRNLDENPATNSAPNSSRSPRPLTGRGIDGNCLDESQVLSVLLSLQESCRVIVVTIDFLNSLCEYQASKKQEDALKRLEGLANDQKALETEKESLLAQVQDLLIQLQLSQEKNFTLRSSNDELFAENASFRSEIDLLNENKINCNQLIEKLNGNNTRLENEVDSLKVKLESFESSEIERNMMDDQLQVVKEERDSSRMNEESLFAKVGTLSLELELLQESYVAMTDRLNEVMDENMDLKDKLDDFNNNSRSPASSNAKVSPISPPPSNSIDSSKRSENTTPAKQHTNAVDKITETAARGNTLDAAANDYEDDFEEAYGDEFDD